MRGRAPLLAVGPLLLVLACILAAFTTRTRTIELAENEPVYLPQLDAALTVSDCRVDYHPGTAAPRDYSCRFAIATESDAARLRASVNRPARHRGHKLYLAGTRTYQDPFRFRVVLTLRRFPAWPLAFIAFTLAIALGMVWAEQAWANFWSWDPKETWALVTWLLMALALVLRLAGRERVERVVTALAFATVLYNYVVVNLVLRGLHSYR